MTPTIYSLRSYAEQRRRERAFKTRRVRLTDSLASKYRMASRKPYVKVSTELAKVKIGNWEIVSR